MDWIADRFAGRPAPNDCSQWFGSWAAIALLLAEHMTLPGISIGIGVARHRFNQKNSAHDSLAGSIVWSACELKRKFLLAHEEGRWQRQSVLILWR